MFLGSYLDSPIDSSLLPTCITAFWSGLLWDVLWLSVVSQWQQCWRGVESTFTLEAFFRLRSPYCFGCTLHPLSLGVLLPSSSLTYV